MPSGCELIPANMILLPARPASRICALLLRSWISVSGFVQSPPLCILQNGDWKFMLSPYGPNKPVRLRCLTSQTSARAGSKSSFPSNQKSNSRAPPALKFPFFLLVHSFVLYRARQRALFQVDLLPVAHVPLPLSCPPCCLFRGTL